jgi:hypothetical protein
MLNTGHIEPNWNIEDFKTLNYKFDTHKDDRLLNEYASHGHSKMYMTLWNYFQPNPMPKSVDNYIIPAFDHLDHIAIAINLFKPGQYLPMHVDLFGRYKQVNKLNNEEVTRIIIMLEDSQPGQVSQACGKTFGEWVAGDWIQWDSDDPHAVYNLSMHNRYAIQITGTKR